MNKFLVGLHNTDTYDDAVIICEDRQELIEALKSLPSYYYVTKIEILHNVLEIKDIIANNEEGLNFGNTNI